MKSCHYILRFICLNAHPEWWPFLPGASRLPSCYYPITPALWTYTVWLTTSDWFEALCLHAGGVLKVSFCRVECELWDKRMTDTWAAGVFIYVLKQPEQLTKWGGAVTVCFSSSPLRRWTIAQNKSLIPSPWWSPSGGPRRSDINKKSQLTTLFAGLMSRCKVSHRSGVKAVMACEWVSEREEIRALKDLKSLCVELLIDRPNIICLLISSRISGWWLNWLNRHTCTLMLRGHSRHLCSQ